MDANDRRSGGGRLLLAFLSAPAGALLAWVVLSNVCRVVYTATARPFDPNGASAEEWRALGERDAAYEDAIFGSLLASLLAGAFCAFLAWRLARPRSK